MTINKSCAQYCIDLIRCLLQEKEIPQIPKDVALQELFEFSRHHNVEAMLRESATERKKEFMSGHSTNTEVAVGEKRFKRDK